MPESSEKSSEEDAFSAISHICHNFNNGLAIILGHIELSLLVKEESKRQEHLDGAKESIAKLKSGLRQTLVYRHHLKELSSATVKLADAMQFSLSDFRESLPSSVEFRVQLDKSLEVAIPAQRLNEIIVNLLLNAQEAVDGSGIISLTAVKKGECVCLTVKDDGCGMKESVLAQACDPFFSNHSRVESVGLGLTIVKGIVENYRGQLEISSEKDKGCTVVVSLPAVS